MKELIERIKDLGEPPLSGRVTGVVGLLIESKGPEVCVGEICIIYGKNQKKTPCEVVGFREGKVLLMSLGDHTQIAPGAEVYPMGEVHRVAVSKELVGRVLDALGKPMDGKGEFKEEKYYPVAGIPPHPLQRELIKEILPTSIKAIDTLCTLGKGQRIGIFSKAGVGKSTLMAMLAKSTSADINVIALIGERGREVRDFIEQELGPEGLARSIVIVATADQPALLRCKGASVATAIAEYFRDLGMHVLLMMDSVSRYAMALREVGLASGEPLASRGYPPSVLAKLPQLLERAGNSAVGSITGIYTILSEEDEMSDPIADQMRSLLDGHIILSRKLAEAGHFPPIDPLASLSRVMHKITDEQQQTAAKAIRELLHTYQEAEELINIGAYVPGSNPKIDKAIAKQEKILQLLKQKNHEKVAYATSTGKIKEFL